MRIKKIVILILSCLLLITPRVAFAEGNQTVKECVEAKDKCQDKKTPDRESNEVSSNEMVSGWDFFKMFLAFAFVIALLYLLLRFLNKRQHGLRSNKLIQNLGGTALGSNRSIQVVKVGERLLVLGVGESVQLLSEVTGDEKEQLIELHSQLNQQTIEPSKMLGQFKWPFLKEKPEQTPKFNQVLKKEMNEMIKKRKQTFEHVEKDENKYE
ncbi:hypothetical protein AMD01_12350 [Priestia koreensis]|uniref:Flagellar protein n=2 Tax=Priestia koreensis TaxID=284581 RepID=A0A0M0L6W1_9BACI|nr:hypothetical protein AMD01_12350 [Priestia koreensis]